ncbi:amidase [Halomarina halobia]|uniref:Amidase n=1 Tax=Halomarina halobia TaxID=3033386 RepID=A0ABD6AFT4_9EURY|nr:amidase [Halomarina sp. PSR21]
MASDPWFRSATDLSRVVRSGKRAATDHVEDFLERIDQCNDVTNAYVHVLSERAQAAADGVGDGTNGDALQGVPVAVKDNIDVAGVPTTFGAVPMADNVPRRSAVAVERVEDAGAIVIGKTNTPEFGHRSTTDNPLYGPTSTPFDPMRTAGGSSGGSAAAVADGLATVALGTDGGGSLRIPASACGVYGHKPSAGLVASRSRPDGFGHTPFVEVGPITRTVADAATVLNAIAGPHSADPLCQPTQAGEFCDAVKRPVDLRVAWTPTLGLFPIAPMVRETVGEAVTAIANAGAIVERVDPDFQHSREELREAWQCGFEVRLARTREVIRAERGIDLLKEDVTPLLRTLIERGDSYSATTYKRADIARTAVFDVVQSLFEEYDLLVSSTLSIPPFDKKSLGPEYVNGEKIDPVFGWCLTWPFNMTGHPAASVPAGLVDGLPVGMQIVGPRFRDDLVLAAAAAVERDRPWIDTYPGAGNNA